MTRDPDSLPDLADPAGPCPRCGRVAAFNPNGPQIHLKADGSQRACVLTCMGCQDSLVVVEQMQQANPQTVPIYEGMHWWPTPGLADLDPAIPAEVGSAYQEGIRALSVKAPRAAAVMFRAMLAQFVADKGSPEAQGKRTLYERLEQMNLDGSLHASLADWAKEIRVLGNAAAHPDTLDPVSDEEAAELGRLCRQLLNVVYEVPARITRGRAARGSAL